MAKLVSFEGKNYSFPDDATDEEITTTVDRLTTPANTLDVLKAVPEAVQAEAAKQLEGTRQFLGEAGKNMGIAGAPLVLGSQLLEKRSKENVAQTQEAVQTAVPDNATSLQKDLLSAGTSVVSNVVPTLTGASIATAAARAGAPLLTSLGTAAAAVLPNMAIGEGMKEFGKQQDAGMSPGRAGIHAAVTTAAEYFPEKWGMTKLVDAVGGKSKVGRAALEFLFRDMAGEQVTTATEDLNSKLSTDPNMTLADWWEHAKSTFITTAVSGPVQGGVIRAGGTILEAAAPRTGKEPRQPVPDAVPSTTPEQTAGAPEDTSAEVVNSPQGKGSLVVDSALPIIGQPSQTEGNNLSIEDQITLLRKAYEDMQATSFQDDAVTRIRKRGEFQARLADVNEELRLNPEGRSFLVAADAAMGVQNPGMDMELEQEVNDYAVLTPEQAQTRAALREQEAQQGWVGTPLQHVPLDPNNPTAGTLGQTFNITGNEAPGGPSEFEHWGAKYMQEQLVGQPVLRSTNPELVGMPFEQALAQASPSDIIFADKPAYANASNVAEAVSFLQSLKDKFLPNSTLVIAGHHPEDSLSSAFKIPGVNAYGLHLPLASFESGMLPDLQTVGTTASDYTRLPMTKAVSSVSDTLTHEFEHILHAAHWASSTPVEKASVAKEYHDDLRFASQASIADAARRLYSAETAEWIIATAKAKGLDPNTVGFTSPEARAVLPMYAAVDGKPKSRYWFNMQEWMAHKGVKYFQTRLGVARENVPFFRRWIQKMKAFYDNYTAQFAAPGPAFAQWMDNIAVRESYGLGLATTQDVENARSKMIEAGVHPDVAALVTTVNADRRQVLNNAVYAAERRAQTVQSTEAYEVHLGGIGQAFFGGQSRDSVVKALENSELGQALLASPQFSDPKNFNVAEFAHSLYARMFAVGEQHSFESGDTLVHTFTSPQGHTVAAYYSKSTKQLTVDASAYLNEAGALSAELGAVTQTLPKLAEAGHTVVDVSQLSTAVRKVLVGKAQSVDVKHMELPYWSYEAPAEPVEPAMQLPASVVSIGAKLGVPWMNTAGNQLGRFNWLFGKALSTYELINLNANVPGMQEERVALRNRMMYRHQWLAPANERVEEWAYKIGKTEAAKLGKLLFDEAENGVHYSTRHRDPNNPTQWIYIMDPSVAKNRGIDQRTQELYSKVRNDFRLFAEEWHKTALWEFARGELSDVTQQAAFKLLQEPGNVDQVIQIVNGEISSIKDPVRLQRLLAVEKDINDQFRAWTDKPYMPYTRFGRYGALVRDGNTGKTLYFSGHDSIAEAREKAKELESNMPGQAVTVTYMEDNEFELAGLPPAILQAMRKKLQLDPQQQEVLSAILQQLSLANSFKNHAAQRKGIEGFSLDALRAYSDYFRRGSAFMARVKSNPQLADAQTLLKNHIQAVGAQVGLQETANLQRLHEWFSRLHKYLNAPGDEYGQLKSAVAMFHFAGNVSSAAMNATQVSLVTLPWLSERYGVTESVKEVGKAYKDAFRIWAKKSPLSPDEQALYEHALESGFLDESQATVIGQMADGAALSRATLTGWSQKTVGAVNHYGMWMFSKVEFLNRVTTMLASYRLARSNRFQGKFDQAAYDFARQAVEDTQNEYAQENRPEIMRGKGSVVMQFMHYTTHMLFMQLGGDKSWWRLLIAQLFAGGLLGLPFAEDLTNMAKFLGRKVGQDWEPELLLREHLKALGVDQDLVARGLFSDMFGFDLSKRVSMGEVVPGVRAVGSNRKFDQVIYDAIGDVAGPGASLVLNAMKFLSEDDKLAWDALKRVAPTAAKNIGNAAQAYQTGEVKDGSGAKVFEPDVWDVAGMAAGFQPKQLAEHYLKGTLQSEQAAYWVNRKQALLDIWDHIVFERSNDREAMADFMKRLTNYNESAPPGMLLSGAALRASAVGRAKARARKEAGLGSTRGMEVNALATQQTLEE